MTFTDDTFLAQLSIGHTAERIIAARLALASVPVYLPPQSVRATADDAGAYRDSVDLWVGTWRVEVKTTSRPFTGPHDLPFSSMFVDTVAKWDAHDPPARAVLLMSQPTGAVVALWGATSGRWSRVEREDRVRGYTEAFYAAPRELWRGFDNFCRYAAREFAGWPVVR